MTMSAKLLSVCLVACMSHALHAAEPQSAVPSDTDAKTEAPVDKLTLAWNDKLEDYTKELVVGVRQAYLKKLAKLTDEEIRQIQIDRFCITIWFRQFDKGVEQSSPMVAAEFRKPAWGEACEAGFRRMRESLILPAEEIAKGSMKNRRHILLNMCERMDKNKKSNPAAAFRRKKSPSGIGYPAMNQGIGTQLERFQRYERSVIMANTIAGPENDKVLIDNEHLSDDLDIEESRAIQYINERRLLAGSCAYHVDGLLAAAGRDHATDAAECLNHVVAHSSDKGDYFQRMARFGVQNAATEGMSFGWNGPNAVDSQCYGGGHTVAVYSPGAQEIGVGCRMCKGELAGMQIFVICYGSSKPRRTPWYEDGFFLPPGITTNELTGAVARAYESVRGNGPVDLKSLMALRNSMAGKANADAAAIRFIVSYIELQIDHEVSLMDALMKAGDWCGLDDRVAAASLRLSGLSRFDAWAAHYRALLSCDKGRRELERGRAYDAMAKAAAKEEDSPELRNKLIAELGAFVKTNSASRSAYVDAAKMAVSQLNGEKTKEINAPPGGGEPPPGLQAQKVTVSDAFNAYFMQKVPALVIPHPPAAPVTLRPPSAPEKPLPAARAARKLSAENLAALDKALLGVLVELSDSKQLKQIQLGISKTRSKVCFAAADKDGSLTFRIAESSENVTYKYDELVGSDRAALARMVASLKPGSTDAQAMAGVYMESDGRTKEADDYYKKAGQESADKLQKLFD